MSRPTPAVDLASITDAAIFIQHSEITKLIRARERADGLLRGGHAGLAYLTARAVLDKYDKGKRKGAADKCQGLIHFFGASFTRAAWREQNLSMPAGMRMSSLPADVDLDGKQREALEREEIALHPLADDHTDHDRLRRRLTAAEREVAALFRLDNAALAERAGCTVRTIQLHKAEIMKAAPGGRAAMLSAAQRLLARLRGPQQLGFEFGGAA